MIRPAWHTGSFPGGVFNSFQQSVAGFGFRRVFIDIMGAPIVFKMRFCYRFDPSYVSHVLSNQGL